MLQSAIPKKDWVSLPTKMIKEKMLETNFNIKHNQSSSLVQLTGGDSEVS